MAGRLTGPSTDDGRSRDTWQYLASILLARGIALMAALFSASTIALHDSPGSSCSEALMRTCSRRLCGSWYIEWMLLTSCSGNFNFRPTKYDLFCISIICSSTSTALFGVSLSLHGCIDAILNLTLVRPLLNVMLEILCPKWSRVSDYVRVWYIL